LSGLHTGVTKDTKLGVVGSARKRSRAVHLQLEVDTNADTEYPTYKPTLSGNSNVFKASERGNKDTTFNPAEVLHCKTSALDYQLIPRTIDGYTGASDMNIPVLS
jgi:hypothetical protein